MKKIILLLCILTFPLTGYAKYCPSCLSTFQVQTINGQTKLLYEWLMKAMNPQYPIEKQNIQYLFDKRVTININGRNVARGLPGVFHYLQKIRQQQPLLSSKRRRMLVDQNYATIAYQTISKRKGQKYRSLVIAMLEFKGHKLVRWWAVSHTTKAN